MGASIARRLFERLRLEWAVDVVSSQPMTSEGSGDLRRMGLRFRGPTRDVANRLHCPRNSVELHEAITWTIAESQRQRALANSRARGGGPRRVPHWGRAPHPWLRGRR